VLHIYQTAGSGAPPATPRGYDAVATVNGANVPFHGQIERRSTSDSVAMTRQVSERPDRI